MIIKCSNCGKDLLTEADLIISQHTPRGEYISCGCKEFGQAAYILSLVKEARACTEKQNNLAVNNVLFMIEKKSEIRELYGHEVQAPANQKCGLCGIEAYTSAIKGRCPRRRVHD